ncbi:MAG: HPF/RaiA family ribosome-associated protein [Acidobacteriota bacterium]|nr:MAG: HPF/RaiA family ribosome-associated protein [Acidobacteriota bacterium]
MILPVQITFRNMDSSTAVEDRIREEAAKLDTFYDRIMSCRVVVEIPHHHHQRGNLYHIRIDIGVPGKEIVVRHEPTLHSGAQQTGQGRSRKGVEVQVPHKDIYVAIRDAFKTARREVQDYARRQRGQVKAHEEAPPARIAKLFPDEGYGFIETLQGEEIYFHKNSLINADFEKLEVGAEVAYAVERGDRGPQASTVRVLD